ncbi:tyrosine-type recombinase/integrase [Solemya velum gill symbiont]|uniref:tyrosine-type recombinase/integrase n=1 Tax=Solemya velum gill symbiont TaxID=2340 RepID=UPI000997BB67|nr:integrase family protein [Solemya velum gill symbiont]OOZ42996.1 hypothetical protein BOW37_12520 [Solemya velum gill symbiont]OOZ47038.1 hypothetical protein BOW38_04245 [Solemya velum gill symbiont]OOZ52138.1 hypothetical protein BOW40_03570 [Solemya velum gill symbiont]OOZ54997.1 hypothetical protein BOW41_04815 [Solemya velum gill symbiont]OOZ56654.1 hypothetical protein BOW42_06030 [Solemya velum gill symbiont]
MSKTENNVVDFRQKPDTKIVITKQAIGRLSRRMKPYIVRDSKLRGFGIKVNPKGPMKYIVEARLHGNGRNKRIDLGSVDTLSLTEARQRGRDCLQLIYDGIDPKQAEREKSEKEMSLIDLIEVYYGTNGRIKEENKAIYIRDMRSLLKPFLERRAGDLSAFEYLEFYKRNTAISPAYTDRVHRQLKAVYNYACKKEIVEKNPTGIVTVQDRPVIKPKDRHVNLSTELRPFLKSLLGAPISISIRDAILLFLCTGMRKMELLSLKWDEVDFDQYLIQKRDTKNRQEHVIPMSNLARTLLLSRYDDKDKNDVLVFPSRNSDNPLSDIRKPLEKVLNAAGITENVSPHDLRRTFTAIAQELGINVSDIKPLLNHMDQSVTTKHYLAKHTPRMIKDKRAQLNLISGYLEELATGYAHGIRTELYLDSMFEEEKTADGEIDYLYADAFQHWTEERGMKITHEELEALEPGIGKYRNMELERAYDWEW